MKEKTLFKIALVCSVIGLAVLFFVSDNISIDSVDVSSLDSTDIGHEVKVIGSVSKVSSTDKVVFLTVGQQKVEDVSVVLFKDSSDILIKKGDVVELVGTVDDYEGSINIIANAVKVR